MNPKLVKTIIVFNVFLSMSLFLSFSTSSTNTAFSQALSSGTAASSQPNINAQSLFNTQTMVLGNNVKNLVILIPNEGHHGPGEEDEARFLEQQFVPANAVVNAGTTVGWFSGDVGHEHEVRVKDATGNSVLFTTGILPESQLSKTYTFNTPGTYSYESMVDEGVLMKGTITVKNIQSPVTSPTAAGGIDTVGVLMVPTQGLGKYIQDVKNAGVSVDSTNNFKDLRGGQKGTGDMQSLLVWTSGGKDLSTVIPPLSEISLALPYS